MTIYLSDQPEDPHLKRRTVGPSIGLPIWSCSGAGFTVPVDITTHSGGLLHRRFTLTLRPSFHTLKNSYTVVHFNNPFLKERAKFSKIDAGRFLFCGTFLWVTPTALSNGALALKEPGLSSKPISAQRPSSSLPFTRIYQLHPSFKSCLITGKTLSYLPSK